MKLKFISLLPVLLLSLLLSGGAHAGMVFEDSKPSTVTSTESQSEIKIDAPTELKREAHLQERFAVGISGQMVGSPGNNTYQGDRASVLSDHHIALEGRYFFTENFALGVSLGIVSGIINETRENGAIEHNRHFARPFLVGARYQLSSVFGTSLVKPYVQLEMGATVIHAPESSFGGSSGVSAAPVRLTGRGTVGFDVFFSHASRFFSGFQLGYLKYDDMTLGQMAANIGFLF